MRKITSYRSTELFYWILTIVSIIILVSISANAFSQEKPGPTNTGPSGTLTSMSGGSITTNGAVIEDKSISGNLIIQANNVTIRNCRINANWASYGINAWQGKTGLVVEDCEIYNMTSAGIIGNNFTMRRCDIHESSGDAIKPKGSNILVESCWLHGLGLGAGAHADGVQLDNTSGSNLVFRYNNFDNPHQDLMPPGYPYKSNSAFIISNPAGSATVLVEYNWINGGSYVFNTGGGTVTIRYNKIGRDYKFGIFKAGNTPLNYCNVWEDTGAPVDPCSTNPPVAEPEISPAGGLYSSPVTISMTCATSGAQIRYTLDGSAPTESSTLYTGSFVVNNTTTIKARGYKSGMPSSTTASNTYVIASGDNVALGKSVTVSAHDGNVGSNITDGDIANTRWSADGYPQWAEIDLGSNYDLSAILVYTYQSRAYQYIVEAKSAGGSYSTIVNRSTNTDSSQPIADNVSTTARYVKITVSGASGYSGTWVSINEVEILGTGGGTIVPVTGVSVLPTSLSLEVSETADLTETVSPSNATDKSVSWSSNNTSIATVDNNGLVTAVATGNATITVITADGGFTANCAVTVNAIPVEDNLALGKPVTVSAYQDDEFGYKPGENLVDGDASDDARWSAEGYPQWAEIDLGQNYDLSQIDVYPYQDRAYQYIVEAKPAGGSYVTIVDKSANTESADILVSAVNTTARYVKITVTGASGYSGSWVSIAEMSVWGEVPSTIPVTGVSLSPTSLDLTVGECSGVIETVDPVDATDKSVVWSSSNTSVATVNSSGLVCAVSAGTATITVTTVDGGYMATCVATVTVPVTGVSVTPTSLSIEIGQSADLTETVSPANASNKNVTWSSNNTSVATVNSSGLVTTVAAGNATITVTTVDGSFTANCAVTVNAPVPVEIVESCGTGTASNIAAYNEWDNQSLTFSEIEESANCVAEVVTGGLTGSCVHLVGEGATQSVGAFIMGGINTSQMTAAYLEFAVKIDNNFSKDNLYAYYNVNGGAWTEIDVVDADMPAPGVWKVMTPSVNLPLTSNLGLKFEFDFAKNVWIDDITVTQNSQQKASFSAANNSSLVSIYPNPLHGNTLNINVNGYNNNVVNVTIYDMMGRAVYNQVHSTIDQTELQIPVSGLDNGIYIISINGNQQKLIIE